MALRAVARSMPAASVGSMLRAGSQTILGPGLAPERPFSSGRILEQSFATVRNLP